MGKFLATAGILAFGLWAVYLGMMVRSGRWRGPLLYQGFPVLASPGAFLIAIPVGLGIIAIGLMMVFPKNDLIGLIMVFFFLSGVILSFWMPDWLLPGWFRYLVKNYEHVLGNMLQEANKMGVKEWEKQTCTQEGLERWADNVARKHGWQRQR